MRSVAEFYQDCLSAVGQQPPLDVQLTDAVTCILAEDVHAPFDLPSADLSATDGYAVRSQDVAGATPETPVTLPVTEEVTAGDVNPAALLPGMAIRIASGAPIPSNADAVVALQFTDQGQAQVALSTQPAVGENIRHRAEDVAQGEVILTKGTRLGARQIALLAGVGRDRVLVHPRPRVVVLSIGNELIEPGQEARPGTVFDANGHALASAVADAGAQTFRVSAVPDERFALSETIEDQLVRADVILTTGGISYGSGDTVREVLGALGTVRFDNIAAWPGHMMGVGTICFDDTRQGNEAEGGVSSSEGRLSSTGTSSSGGKEMGIPIFCLPGDPVAAQVCFEIYVRPALRHMQGWTSLNRPAIKAAVDRSWYSPRGRREFVRVRLSGDPRSGYHAKVMGAPASLWLSALADCNALAVVPEDTTNVRAGDVLQCLLLEQ